VVEFFVEIIMEKKAVRKMLVKLTKGSIISKSLLFDKNHSVRQTLSSLSGVNFTVY